MTGKQASARDYTGPQPPSRCELGHSLLEAMPGAAFVCDLAGSVIDCNAHARALWGDAMRDGAAGEGFFPPQSTGAPPDAPSAESPMARVRRQQQPLRDFETLVQPVDGPPHRAIASVVPLVNDDGALWGVVNSFHVADVEATVESGVIPHADQADGRSHDFSDAARQRDQLWRSVLQALPVAIYMTDAEGRVTFFNDAAVHFVGRTPKLGEPWSISWKLFHLDGRPMPHSEGPMATALRERRPLHGEEAITEQPGGLRLAFKAYPTPLFDEAGQLVGAVNLMVDITEHRKIEQALQDLNSTLEKRVVHRTNTVEKMFMKLHRSESHFELLVKNVTDYAAYMLDPDGHIISWNEGAERVKGYAAAEIMGRHFSTFYTPEDRDKGIPEAALAAARRNGSFGAEGWRVRKDGSRFWASVVIHTTIDDGQLVGFVKITRDITERREH